jgi:hypothetical protein
MTATEWIEERGRLLFRAFWLLRTDPEVLIHASNHICQTSPWHFKEAVGGELTTEIMNKAHDRCAGLVAEAVRRDATKETP